ncbi:MAG TPA: LD-carboxypeptidase [Candidatus Eisenbacteria bacterium]|nr:LD-carboxypeptidase [Candidatus Eisenbacteria bacterium]
MPTSNTKSVKPPALRPGDTIGIIAPASNVNRSEFEAGCAALRRAGYNPVYSDSIFDRDLYFAGSLDRRVRELEEVFERDDVRAIICARGGYGANYLLNKLDLRKIQPRPKIFVGYSDITCLLTHFTDNGLITFHGPMVAKDWVHDNGVELESWQSALSVTKPWNIPLNKESKPLIEGEAEGVLYGGCLSILVASLGTPFQINTKGKILFIEDVAAKPYQIDRMLMQLRIGGHLDHVRGMIFGEMLDCIQSPNQDYTLEDVIVRIVGDLNIPVAFGVKSGHVSKGNITLPFGVEAKLSVQGSSISLTIRESAVSI